MMFGSPSTKCRLSYLQALNEKSLKTVRENGKFLKENDEIKSKSKSKRLLEAWSAEPCRPGIHSILQTHLLAAQCLGLVPVRGICQSGGSSHVRFSWCGKRLFYSMLVCLLYLANLVLYLRSILYRSLNVFTIGEIMYLAGPVLSILLSIRTARQWPEMLHLWEQAEDALRKYKHHNSYGHIKLFAAINYFVVAYGIIILQIIINQLNMSACPRAMTYRELLKVYSYHRQRHVFQAVPYSDAAAVIVHLLTEFGSSCIWFMSNWIVEIQALVLASYYGVINQDIFNAQHVSTPSRSWQSRREDYDRLASLTAHFSDMFCHTFIVMFIVKASLMLSLYFITLSYIKDTGMYLLVLSVLVTGMFRMFMSVLSLSSINDESKIALSSLFSVPNESYNTEVLRLIEQIVHEEQSFSIHNYITITRSLILTVCGITVSYLVLIRQITKSNPITRERPTRNHTYCDVDLGAVYFT